MKQCTVKLISTNVHELMSLCQVLIPHTTLYPPHAKAGNINFRTLYAQQANTQIVKILTHRKEANRERSLRSALDLNPKVDHQNRRQIILDQ